MANTLKIRRGLKSSLPTLAAGEPGWCTDTYELFIGDGSVNRLVKSQPFYTFNNQATTIPTASEVRFARFTVPTGKTLKIKSAGIYPSGVANHIVEVYNLTDSVSVYSTNSSFVEGDLASVVAGKEVTFRINNTSGAEQAGSIGFVGFTVE